MLEGRLGLETARQAGALTFVCAGGGGAPAGAYAIPHQSISLVLLGPGGSVTQDALRLLARHGAGLVAVCEDGVRLYRAPPLLPDTSALARRQVELWSDAKGGPMQVARRMYAMRLGEFLPHRDISVLRGIEGAQSKKFTKSLPSGLAWPGMAGDMIVRIPARPIYPTRR